MYACVLCVYVCKSKKRKRQKGVTKEKAGKENTRRESEKGVVKGSVIKARHEETRKQELC